MGYFQVRYDSRVVNYDRRGFIRLATVGTSICTMYTSCTCTYTQCIRHVPIHNVYVMLIYPTNFF